MKNYLKVAGLLVVGVTILSSASLVGAAPVGQLNQSINAGTITTDIVDEAGAPVVGASFSMAPTSISTMCQTSTGVYGSNTQRVAVDNPGGANGGWTLAIALTDGPGTDWVSGTDTYKADDPAGSGCTNGQLTLDPSAATLGLIGASTSTGITQGSATAFSNGSVDSITLINAAGTSDDIWSGYLTDIGISQTIPPQTAAGSYSIDLTQTVTAS